ncbi:MAG: hypothetical protein DRH04_08365, partial [Deltaproteobacteria bacterium]
YLFHRDGRLVYKHPVSSDPPDMAEMIQGYITQGYSYNEIKHGRDTIYIEFGEVTCLAVLFKGVADERLRQAMRSALQETEILYGQHLARWDGSLVEMGRLGDIMKKHIRDM